MRRPSVRLPLLAVFGVIALVAAMLTGPPLAGAQDGPFISTNLTYEVPDSEGMPDYVWVNNAPGAFDLTVDFENDGTVDFARYDTTDWQFPLGTVGHIVHGTYIVAAGDGWLAELMVMGVRVEYADPVANRAGGFVMGGELFVTVEAQPPGGGPPNHSDVVLSDHYGYWSYDFGAMGYDLLEGEEVAVRFYDYWGESFNVATAQTAVVHATMNAGPAGYVLLNQWSRGTLVDVSVDFDGDMTFDYSQQIEGSEFGDGIVLPESEQSYLRPGSIVDATAHSGIEGFKWSKSVTLVDLGVAGFDADADLVTGHAPPDSTVYVEVHSSGFGPPPAVVHDVAVDGNGDWTADFTSVGYDIPPDVEGFVVRHADADGDTSGSLYYSPGPPQRRIDLFRFIPFNPDEPWAGGTPGDIIEFAEGDTVAHLEWIWVQGQEFEPYGGYQLNECEAPWMCRNLPSSMPWVNADETGSFGIPLQVGRNVFGPFGEQMRMTIDPVWDLRDGQTVAVSAEGLPRTDYGVDCEPYQCAVVAVEPWEDGSWTSSSGMVFSGDPVPIDVRIGQAVKQQMQAYVHIEPVDETTRSVQWNGEFGTLSYGFTGVERWVTLPEWGQPYSPEPEEPDGAYDCADELPYDPLSGATESLHCALVLGVVEGDQYVAVNWPRIDFAAFDLDDLAVTKAELRTKPSGVQLSGEVSCTGFMGEEYSVAIEGVLSQTSAGKKTSTSITGDFVTTTTCTGTMTNPGKGYWSVFVPGSFKSGGASVVLDASSAGFTRIEYPVHVETTVTLTNPTKIKGNVK